MENSFWKANRVFARGFESLNTISSTSRFVVDEQGRGRSEKAGSLRRWLVCIRVRPVLLVLPQNRYVRKV